MRAIIYIHALDRKAYTFYMYIHIRIRCAWQEAGFCFLFGSISSALTFLAAVRYPCTIRICHVASTSFFFMYVYD